MIQVPIIIPQPMPIAPRDCIVVDGKKYCRDIEAGSAAGFFLFLGIGLVVLTIWALPGSYLIVDTEWPIVGILWMLSFPFFVALICWWFGM